MARPQRNTLAMSDYIADVLSGEIVAGRRPPGSRLPSMRLLAKRFKTSVFPVQQAVVSLADQGYVEQRHGSGVIVRDRPAALKMTDNVMLCMQSTGHVFGELACLLHNGLHDLGLFASVLDTSHGDGVQILRQAQYSEARILICHGGPHFRYHALEQDRVSRKCLIAVLDWESDWFLDQVHRIVLDHPAGSQRVAEHLWAAGHRHVLLAAPDDMLARAAKWDGKGECPPEKNVQGAGFAVDWERRGGRVTPLEDYLFSQLIWSPSHLDRLCALLDAGDPPTALFGLRDVDVWEIREELRRVRPDILKRLAFVGQGDTPWSQASHPPFTTLNWRLDEIAPLACGIVRDLEAGKTFRKPVVRLIPPRLEVR
jgi:DNA-binding LacI/PurR family transcriptional regulator